MIARGEKALRRGKKKAEVSVERKREKTRGFPGKRPARRVRRPFLLSHGQPVVKKEVIPREKKGREPDHIFLRRKQNGLHLSRKESGFKKRKRVLDLHVDLG